MVISWVVRNKVAASGKPSSFGDIKLWKAEGIGSVVVLNEDHELKHLGGLQGYLEVLRDLGFEVLSTPIRDFWIPTLEQALETVKWIESRVKAGDKVLIHCNAGLGRTGVISACYLVYTQGMSWREAVAKVREARPGSLENLVQEKFVEKFEKYVKKRGGP
ncbi:MAG: hypothetical protein DRJ41_02765 [Thermoprotei archaeon]|nr:MAG: hypothetical protein DRJ41_02765 [Thermoprotei archaeon]